MIVKDDGEVRLQGGNDFQTYFDNQWITLGNIMSGKLSRKSSPKEIKYNNGYTFDKRTGAKCSLSIVLGQVSKEILDTIDQILVLSRPLYISNGINNTKGMEFFVPKGNLIENLDLTMEGDVHQTLALEFSIIPQISNASVIPSSGMPANAFAHAVNTLQVGFNPFYICLETVVV